MWTEAVTPYQTPVLPSPSLPTPRGLVAMVCLLAAAGCDIRDEAVRPVMQDMLGGTAASGAGAAAGDLGLEYVSGYEDGLKRATAEQKPLLLVFRASWCRFSAEMTLLTLLDPQVVSLSRRSVCVMVDADRDPDTCRHFGVKAFPTLIVVTRDGGEQLRLTGRASAATLAAALQTALENPQVAGAGGTVTR